jgi:hypothetical protein
VGRFPSILQGMKKALESESGTFVDVRDMGGDFVGGLSGGER